MDLIDLLLTLLGLGGEPIPSTQGDSRGYIDPGG